MELPENPIAFESYDMDNPYYDAEDDDGDEGYVAFAAIEYNNRTYIPYGSLDGMIFPVMEYEECIGYLVDEEDPDDMDFRVYPLKDDPEHNFLATVLVSGFMEQPFYYRAIDTNEKDIEVPEYIDSYEYDYWKQGVDEQTIKQSVQSVMQSI